jgi:hypothetical protein
MKKIKLIVISLITVFCLVTMAACGSDNNQTNTTTNNKTESKTEDKADTKTNSQTTNKSDNKTIYSQDVKVINNTGVEIHKMYISASDKNDWEEDILNKKTMPTGTELNITFDAEEKSQYWDLRIEDSEGTSLTWEKIDLFTISEITLNFDGKTATATYK